MLGALVVLATVTPVAAEDIAVITQDLRRHSDAAKAEGGAGMKAIAAGNIAGGCPRLRQSEAEILKVRELLAKWREQLMLDAKLPVAEVVTRQQKIDVMDGQWLLTLSQVREKIASHCNE
jgi:hypothetical protein